MELLNCFSVVLNVLVVGQGDSKEPIGEITEGAVALGFIVLFKSLVGGICNDVVPWAKRSGNESVVLRLYEDSKLQKKEKRIRSSAPGLI